MATNDNIFNRLKRFFSSDVVVRNIGGRRLRVVDIDSVQKIGDRRMNDKYTRLYSTLSYGTFAQGTPYGVTAARLQLFRDYEVMDMDAIISAALDVFSEESTLKNEMGYILRIKSGTKSVREVLENLFYDIMNIEFNLPTWVRGMCKYGDYFLYLDLAKEYGVTGVMPLPVYEVTRLEGIDPKKPDEVKFVLQGMTGKAEFEKFQVAHFRLNSDSNFLPYGKSIIEGARRVWKQLILMEDAMLIHRIMRAPEKRVFKIDVGNLAPNEVDAYMEVIMNKVKKIPYIDESTGEYNLKFNMQNITEDFYLPVRGGDSGTSIESLAGLEYNAIDDIAYLKDKLMAALKVPKAFLGYEEALNCIVPETKIPLLNGKTKTVAELIKDYENGITNYAYSINQKTNSIVPGKITWAGFTRKNAELVRVKLDNEKYIDCTSDHKFLTRDGRWVEAKDLLVGQSLMPLYLNETDRGYSTVYQPNNEKYKEVHRVVAEHYGLVKKGSGCVVHHKDFTKENNYPENFDCSMDYWGHRRYHQNLKKGQKSGKYINCESCGKSFYTYPYRDRNAKYCSYECYHNDMKTGENRKCVCCGKEFWAELGRNRKYCSFECSCKDYGNDRIDNIKYTKVQYENLLDAAKNSKSFKELRHRLGLTDIKTLYKLFDRFGINKETFICENMLLAMNNKRFIHKYVLNHKVVSVEFLTERKNTCDITIEEYSNFATDAGVIVHNSKATLASQDVRFSRTVERLQKVIISELTKIALVHLFIQGFKGSDLVDFELELTIPSIIYEQEKVELWNSKISLARDAKDTKMRSTYWIYKNIFNMTEDEIAEEKEQVVEDAKLAFRLSQIETEGNDPAKTDQTFGGEETDEAGRNEKFNLNYDKTESSGSADKKKEEYEPVNPSDDGRRGKKLRTRDKDEPFGDDPLGQRDYEKILKLDTQLNYDANKNKHLSRRLKHAEAVLGRRLITTSKPDILKEFEGDFEIKLKDFFSESKTKPKENKEVNNNENDE